MASFTRLRLLPVWSNERGHAASVASGLSQRRENKRHKRQEQQNLLAGQEGSFVEALCWWPGGSRSVRLGCGLCFSEFGREQIDWNIAQTEQIQTQLSLSRARHNAQASSKGSANTEADSRAREAVVVCFKRATAHKQASGASSWPQAQGQKQLE